MAVIFFSLPFDLEASDSGKIGCALNRCVNLKDLRMLHPPTANPNRPLSLAESNKSKAWGLLHKRPFRLAKFTDTYFDGWGSGFSETQSEIRLLSIPKSHTFPVEGWGRPLTCLVALEARPQAIPRTGSLKHVQVHLHDLSRDWSRDLHALDSLRHHMSLQTLSFVRHGNKNVSTFDIVDRVADILPDLRHLSISEPKETANLNSIPREEGSLVSALQRFTGIESFVLQVRNSRTVHFKDESSTLHDMGSSDGVSALGLEIMERCPTLCRVEIGAEVAGGSARTCIFTRGHSAPEIISVRYNTFKWNATDDFYNSLATYGASLATTLVLNLIANVGSG
ncbi:hypothetical protein B0H13DRAFT_2567796 [Mycena leptocephala]|nr:hypothetical protein B0H13DRAFT_2567796 [Mycena leptocephala]